MDDQHCAIIKANPVRDTLDKFLFRHHFAATCKSQSLPVAVESLARFRTEELKMITQMLLTVLSLSPVVDLVQASTGPWALGANISRLSNITRLCSYFSLDGFKPLLTAALADSPDDLYIWRQVHELALEDSPPLLPRNTSSFSTSLEHRSYQAAEVDGEFDTLYVGIPDFCEAFFGPIQDLSEASEAVFRQCQEGTNPLFNQGWTGWPRAAGHVNVLTWLVGITNQLGEFSRDSQMFPDCRPERRLAQPNTRLRAWTKEHQMNIGFVDASEAGKLDDPYYPPDETLIPGVLKRDSSEDNAPKAWLDLGIYAQSVLSDQDTRRFVLGFTLCGSVMRIWHFDRIGAIASESFDINTDGLRFVWTVLGFLWMDREQLGFDPTVLNTSDGQRYIEIERNGSMERIIIDKLITRPLHMAGRATTCWRAHREGESHVPLVLKESWQDTRHVDEGELIHHASEQNTVNVARYYHHETVLVCGKPDDIKINLRRGLDVEAAKDYKSLSYIAALKDSVRGPVPMERSSSSNAHLGDRPARQAEVSATPSKQPHLGPLRDLQAHEKPNRIRRRIILRDYGKPIYRASSRAALLGAFSGCILGHESLRERAGLLHRDISINNLMINEDESNPSYSSFLIDLDGAVVEAPNGVPKQEPGTRGTKAFMSIATLFGKKHNFAHDLESFFWVLWWICMHYDGPNDNPEKVSVKERFEDWHNVTLEELARLKLREVYDEQRFLSKAEEDFTPYYRTLIPWVSRLRRLLFPDGRWERVPDARLYGQMLDILQEAQEDPVVLGHHRGQP